MPVLGHLQQQPQQLQPQHYLGQSHSNDSSGMAANSAGSAALDDGRRIPLLRSCERCRRRKQRCDGGHPSCSRCRTNGADCRYRESGRFRKRFPRSASADRGAVHTDGPALSAATALSVLAGAAATSPGAPLAPGLQLAGAIPAAVPGMLPPPPLPPLLPPPNSIPPRDVPGSALLYLVPELSPSQGMDLSPNNPLIATPRGVHPAQWALAHAGLQTGLPGSPPMIDPLRVLKAYDLPDLATELPEAVVVQMRDLIGSFNDGNADLCGFAASSSAGGGGGSWASGELPPNMDLLDPRNTAANNSQGYAMDNTSWIMGDPMQNLAAAATIDTGPDMGPLPTNDSGVPRALVDLVRRHQLHEQPATLLAMLRQAYVDSGSRLRTRQFWASLEGGNVSDFVLLAHLTIATREAQLSGDVAFQSPPKKVENACYTAAQIAWAHYRPEPTPSTVYALLLLSEYGYQTARTAAMWEFTHHASTIVRRVRVRGAPFPWHGTRRVGPDGAPVCDLELEYVLGCYWMTWLHMVVVAQKMTRRVDPSLSSSHSGPGEQPGLLPECPTHDLCCYTAQPMVPPGHMSPDTVVFPSDTPCVFQPYHTYTAYIGRSMMMGIDVHNLYIDLLEQRCAPNTFLDAVRQWDERTRLWRETWPAEWGAQMDDMLRAARRINNEEHGGRLLVEAADFAFPLSTGAAADRRDSHSQRPAKACTMDVGCHQILCSPTMAEDTLLFATVFLHDMARLRMHRLVLTLLQKRNQGEISQGMSLLFADVPIAFSMGEQARQATVSATTNDLLGDLMELHRCQYVCLNAARNLQSLSTVAELLGVSLMRQGMLGISALELVISVHCARMNHSRSSTATQMDALQRLARILSQLLTLRHWTPVLYIFTAVVKAFVDPTCTVPDCSVDVADSPWPPNHVLTLLMHEMQMTPREFCAVTVPVVYASVVSSANVSPSVRMRIASLLS